MITGQAIQGFEKWYKENHRYALRTETRDYINDMDFDILPFSMQSGVITDFLITKEIWVEVIYRNDWRVYIATIKINDDGFYCEKFSTMNNDRDTALTEAITKAIEIYNKNHTT